MAAGLQEPHHRPNPPPSAPRRSFSTTPATLSAPLDDCDLLSALHATASLPRNAVRYVGAFIDSSSKLAEWIVQNLIPSLRDMHTLHILCSVETTFEVNVDEIKDVTTRKRVLKRLSACRIVQLKVVDLQKIEGFLDWSWKDIQEKLYEMKIEVKFFLYLKGEGQLMKAIEELRLARLYLLGDTGCDTVEDNGPHRCEVLKAGDLLTLPIQNPSPVRQDRKHRWGFF